MAAAAEEAGATTQEEAVAEEEEEEEMQEVASLIGRPVELLHAVDLPHGAQGAEVPVEISIVILEDLPLINDQISHHVASLLYYITN